MRYLIALLALFCLCSVADACPRPFARAKARIVHRERVVHIERGHGLFGFGVVGVRAAPCAGGSCVAPAVVVPPAPKKEEPKGKPKAQIQYKIETIAETGPGVLGTTPTTFQLLPLKK